MKIEKLLVFISTMFLTIIGLVLNASVLTTNSLFFFKSVIIVFLGLAVFLAIYYFFKFEYLKHWWVYLLGGFGMFVLLILTLTIGPEINGAHRWIDMGPFLFQPSEFAKLYAVLLISFVIYKYPKDETRQLTALFTVLLMCVLIYFQPDLGMSFFIFIISMLMFFVAGMLSRVKLKFLAGSFAAALFLFVVLFAFSSAFREKLERMASYQLKRVDRYFQQIFPYKVSIEGLNVKLEPAENFDFTPFSEQSLKVREAIMHATWLGAGISQGSYTKYLPAKHNDYIAVLAMEEMGIIGVMFIGFLFLVLFVSILTISFNSESVFVHYITLGIGFILFLQALFHFGVNFQVLPEKGIALPFVSYGGTSYIANITMIALVLKARVKG